MSKTDKIIIASTIAIVGSAATMMMVSKKYDKKTDTVIRELKDIHKILNGSHDEVIAGNKAIAESNRILRKLIVGKAEDLTK